jgi:UDPglucose 6-dehydrogenase
MRVAVVGTGYVGLVTGVCLADVGHTVVCVDNNAAKVAELQDGKTPIFEPGLSEVLHRTIAAGRISFTTDLAAGVADAAIVFLALPTPPQEDGSADLSAVLAVANALGNLERPSFQVIVDKSTVPVGTAEKVTEVIKKQGGSNFVVVSNPEFLREGFAVADFMHPERIVVGTEDEEAKRLMSMLYAPFVDDQHPLILTDTSTAELAKYAANTFLVTKISFMNEIAHICEETGADIDALRQIIGSDSRIGHKFLYPGIGYGGSCFPKDVRALYHISHDYGYEFKILSAALTINLQQHNVPIEQLCDYFDGSLKGRTIAVWGLAFKPNTDDIREAPALAIITELLKLGVNIQAYDPEAMETVRTHYPHADKITLAYHKYAAAEGADALLIATEWQEFKNADLDRVKALLKQPVIFDGRNIFSRSAMQAQGFTYFSIGRPPVVSATNQ